jgi:uncharacterized membrane protein YhhN
MGEAAWLLLGLAAVLAAGDWVAVARGDKRLEYVCKPATMVALIGVAASLHPIVVAQQRWWLLALVLGLTGDILLMLPRDRFAAGLAAFLLGHAAYILGFRAAGVVPLLALVYLAVLAVPTAIGLIPVIRGAVRVGQRELVAPILLYSLVIGFMAASALAAHSPPAIVGALLFVASDGLIAYRRFVTQRPWMPLAVIITYHLGQAGLVLSLAR